MPRYEYRELEPTREAKEVFCRWINYLDNEFTRHDKPALRAEIVRDNLHQVMLGRPHGGQLNFTLNTELPFNVLQLSLDSANVTMEPEYYGDIDQKKYALIKPLVWFWRMFDRSPIALNLWLGFRLRAMLGKHIFKSIGKNVKIYQGVEFTFGYNLTIEDDCVIHRYAMLDDRGELTIRKGTSVSEHAAIFSHAHDPIEPKVIEHRPTEIGPAARVTYRSVVMPGVRIGENAILGAQAVATHDVEADSIAGGVPAREVKKKTQARRIE
ncbi:acyltransferase [Paracidobacterium acidisoli]|uniref:Acyltransferase n=1 Tax=Paracidobacterium acidisoli TaxID=2303751 RepID=A0A372IPZ8_9BACT|nr:acyltransferase [Paracidobacterium acidisoli]MBT9331285.1 acyltransferase [Paracidobacterium acidisoli]